MAFERDWTLLLEDGAPGVEVHLRDGDRWVTSVEWLQLANEADDDHYPWYDDFRLGPQYDGAYDGNGILVGSLGVLWTDGREVEVIALSTVSSIF